MTLVFRIIRDIFKSLSFVLEAGENISVLVAKRQSESLDFYQTNAESCHHWLARVGHFNHSLVLGRNTAVLYGASRLTFVTTAYICGKNIGLIKHDGIQIFHV